VRSSNWSRPLAALAALALVAGACGNDDADDTTAPGVEDDDGNGNDVETDPEDLAQDVLCTLASDDEYGDTGVEGAEFAADNLGIDIAVQATFPAPSAERPAQDFQAQISQLEGGGCEVILFVSLPSDNGSFADALAENPGYNPTILGQSPTWLGLFRGNAYLQEHYYALAEGSEYGDESSPGMAELVRIKDEYAPDVEPDIYFNFGYLQSMAMVQVLEQAVEDGDLSREGILRAMEDVGTLTFDGLTGDYQYGPAADRVPPTISSIFQVDPDVGTGLGIVAQDYEAPYADQFEFESDAPELDLPDAPGGDPEPGPGFDGSTIRLGVLTPTSGIAAIIGNPLTAGNQAYIDYVNEELGGIAGEYQMELVIEDTAYDPSVAGDRYAAIRDDVVAFVQILGTPVVNALLADLIDDDVVAGPASLDSAWVREPNLLAIGGPYQIQAINGIDWWFREGPNAPGGTGEADDTGDTGTGDTDDDDAAVTDDDEVDDADADAGLDDGDGDEGTDG
jgi:ABC-type branched-subunit amino acid transport system substrate-binding protein